MDSEERLNYCDRGHRVTDDLISILLTIPDQDEPLLDIRRRVCRKCYGEITAFIRSNVDVPRQSFEDLRACHGFEFPDYQEHKWNDVGFDYSPPNTVDAIHLPEEVIDWYDRLHERI